MQQRDDGHMNGHPSWPQLFEIMSDTHHKVGGLEKSLGLVVDHVSRGFDRVHQRIDHLHIHGNSEIDNLRDRVTTLEAAPKPERRGWISSTGLSPKELIGLVIIVITSLTGTLSSDVIVAWLSH